MAEELPLVETMKKAAEAIFLMQQGQELQKRLKAPELKPSLAEMLFRKQRGPIWEAHAGKRDQIARLKEEQMSLAKYFMDSGQKDLVQSVFVPMKDEELSAMSQKYMAGVMEATQGKRAASAPYIEAMTGPAQLDFPTIGTVSKDPSYTPSQFQSGMVTGNEGRGAELYKGMGPTQRPTTASERSSRLNSALTDPDQGAGMILAIQQYLGKDAAKVVQDQLTLQQNHKDPVQQRAAMDAWIEADQAKAAKDRASIATPAERQAALEKQQADTTNIQSTISERDTKQRRMETFGTDDSPALISPKTSVRRAAIVKQSTTMGLDPALTSAILGNEGGSPTAVSVQGAVGDMQIMPETALSEYGITEEQLKDPEIKTMAGLRYLRDLSLPKSKGGNDNYFARTQGKPEAVLAAYFSGPKNVENGKIINLNKADKTGTTVAQYVASGMKRYNQALAATKPDQETLPYAPLKNAGKRMGEGGGISVDPDKARQERAEFNIDQTMNTDPLRIPDMLTLAAKHGGTPSPQRLQIYQDAYTRAAVQDALKSPNYALPLGERYQDAVTRAGQAHPQFFNTDIANKMIPASTAAQAQAQGTVIGTAQGKQSQTFRDVTVQESKDRIQEAVGKQAELAEQFLNQEITDADELAKYPGTAVGTSRRDLIHKKAIPKLPVSQKDHQAASEALAIVDELEARFKKTQPTELFPSVTRWIRDNTTAMVGLETAAEGFDAFRKGRAQLLSRVLSGADTRFSAPEMIAMEDSIPSLYSRPSVAKDIFNSMRVTIQNRLGTPGTQGTGPSGPSGTPDQQITPEQRQALEERNKARFGKGVPPK